MGAGEVPSVEGGATLFRTIWAVSLPIIFLEVAEKLLHVTDTALLGRFGTTEVAALALGGTILESCTVISMGLVEAMLIFIGRRLGQRRHQAVGETFYSGLLLVVFTSLILTGVIKLASPLLSSYAGASHEVSVAVDAYLQIGAYGIIFLSLNLAFAALYISLGRTRVLVAASVVLVLTNLALSYVLIFGKLGLPRLGIEGAALGDVGAEVATCIFLIIYTLRRQPDLRRYGLFRLESWDRNLFWSLVRTSSPISLRALMEVVRWVFFFVIVEEISTEALAWSNIIYACYEVLLIPTMALSVAAFSMVSSLIGKGQAERIGRLIRTLTLSAYLMTVPLVVLGLLFPNVLVSIFTSEKVAIEGVSEGLWIVLLSMLVVVPAEIWIATVGGTGDTDAVLVIELFLSAAMLIAAYVAVFVVSSASLTYVWISLPLAEFICLALSYGWVKGGYWKRRHI